jgi:hypothetical protein
MRLQSFSVLVWSFMLVLVPGVLGQVQTPSSTLSLSSLPICAVGYHDIYMPRKVIQLKPSSLYVLGTMLGDIGCKLYMFSY